MNLALGHNSEHDGESCSCRATHRVFPIDLLSTVYTILCSCGWARLLSPWRPICTSSSDEIRIKWCRWHCGCSIIQGFVARTNVTSIMSENQMQTIQSYFVQIVRMYVLLWQRDCKIVELRCEKSLLYESWCEKYWTNLFEANLICAL